MSDDFRDANARSKLIFNVDPADARELSRHTQPEVDEHDLAHLDVYTANTVRDVVSEPDLWRRGLLLLDLTEVAFLDSTGLSVLVATRRIARARGAELRVVCPSGAALRVIRMTKLDAVFSIHPDRAEALAVAG